MLPISEPSQELASMGSWDNYRQKICSGSEQSRAKVRKGSESNLEKDQRCFQRLALLSTHNLSPKRLQQSTVVLPEGILISL